MSKSSSFLASLLVSAIVGLSHMAKAIQISDFTKTPTKGYCVDGNRNYFAWVETPPGVISTEAAMLNYCVRYCGQNLVTTFRGFEHFIDQADPTLFFCSCYYELPNYDESTPFPYQFTPFPADVGHGSNGTGAIADGDGDIAHQCYKYNGTPTGSASPTGSHTPAPTVGSVGASDFTYVGEGNCVDNNMVEFSYTLSEDFPWTSQHDAAAKCTSWCGQNVNANFRAFVIDYYPSNSPPGHKCKCYFDLPGQMPPYYGYVPPREEAYWRDGTGSIVKFNPTFIDHFCYKYNGSSGGGTLHPTKAPTKPGSCPVGHRPCAGAADCSGTGFSHCVDACCANIGSKSAKGTKSSKRI